MGKEQQAALPCKRLVVFAQHCDSGYRSAPVIEHLAGLLEPVERGEIRKLISEMLGHTTVRMTLDTYSKSLPSLHEDAAVDLAATLLA